MGCNGSKGAKAAVQQPAKTLLENPAPAEKQEKQQQESAQMDQESPMGPSPTDADAADEYALRMAEAEEAAAEAAAKAAEAAVAAQESQAANAAGSVGAEAAVVPTMEALTCSVKDASDKEIRELLSSLEESHRQRIMSVLQDQAAVEQEQVEQTQHIEKSAEVEQPNETVNAEPEEAGDAVEIKDTPDVQVSADPGNDQAATMKSSFFDFFAGCYSAQRTEPADCEPAVVALHDEGQK